MIQFKFVNVDLSFWRLNENKWKHRPFVQSALLWNALSRRKEEQKRKREKLQIEPLKMSLPYK